MTRHLFDTSVKTSVVPAFLPHVGFMKAWMDVSYLVNIARYLYSPSQALTFYYCTSYPTLFSSSVPPNRGLIQAPWILANEHTWMRWPMQKAGRILLFSPVLCAGGCKRHARDSFTFCFVHLTSAKTACERWLEQKPGTEGIACPAKTLGAMTCFTIGTSTAVL